MCILSYSLQYVCIYVMYIIVFPANLQQRALRSIAQRPLLEIAFLHVCDLQEGVTLVRELYLYISLL